MVAQVSRAAVISTTTPVSRTGFCVATELAAPLDRPSPLQSASSPTAFLLNAPRQRTFRHTQARPRCTQDNIPRHTPGRASRPQYGGEAAPCKSSERCAPPHTGTSQEPLRSARGEASGPMRAAAAALANSTRTPVLRWRARRGVSAHVDAQHMAHGCMLSRPPPPDCARPSAPDRAACCSAASPCLPCIASGAKLKEAQQPQPPRRRSRCL